MKRWIATGLMVAAAINLWAQAPEMFRYQGRLVDGTNLVNATLPISFKLYDAQSGGNLVYEDSSPVLVVDGLYSTMIGDNTVFGSLTNAMTNMTVYLELTINGETLSPRERLVSVPYALNAGGNTTPVGTVVLSSAYPDQGLQSQGYSAVKTIPGQNWLVAGTCPTNYPPGNDCLISFAGKMWLLSWSDGIWNSTDGTQWQCVNTSIGCAAGAGFSVAVFNNKMWLLGGYANTVSFNDIWCSEDGITWELVTDEPAWSPRTGAAVTVFDNKLWLMGGSFYTGSGFVCYNDIWWSADGINWNLATANAAWSSRFSPTAFEFQGDLWVIGGQAIGGYLKNDVWRSGNGKDWICAATNLSCTPACVFDNKIYITGDDGFLRTSTNGASWQISGSFYRSNTATKLIAHNNALWCIGSVAARSDLIKQDNGLYYYRKD